MSRARTDPPSLRRLLLGGLLLLTSAGAAARTSPMPQIPQPQTPQTPPMPGGQPLAPVVPDTAWAELVLPDGGARPRGLRVQDRSVVFGGVADIALDLPAGAAAPADSACTFAEPWLAAVPGSGWREVAAGEGVPPAESGTTTWVRPYRIYRPFPFGVRSGSLASGVTEVVTRSADLQQTAAVRDPRVFGLRPATWVYLAALLLLLLLVLAVWLRRRRRRPAEVPHRPVRAPAWPEAVVTLRALVEQGGLDRGETRVFLDRFSAIVRRFAGRRFLVGAEEMTGSEILEACRARRFAPGPVQALAGLLDQTDLWRYDPQGVGPVECRQAVRGFLDVVLECRLQPVGDRIGARDLLEADQAQVWLQREFGATPSDPAGVGGGR